jgi:hypothetical protein
MAPRLPEQQQQQQPAGGSGSGPEGLLGRDLVGGWRLGWGTASECSVPGQFDDASKARVMHGPFLPMHASAYAHAHPHK